MKKINLSIVLFLSATLAFAQNVGIGTPTPEYTLHVKSSVPFESSVGVNAAGTASQALVNLSIDNRSDGNSLSLLKYRPGVAGTVAGIPKSNLSFVGADFGAGPLLMSTNQNSNMYFATNSLERMRITNVGYVGINTTNPIAWLNVTSNNNIPPIYARNDYSSGQAFGISGEILSSNGAGVSGATTNSGGGNSGYTVGPYGVIGTSAATGTGVGAFSLNGGTALRAEIMTGTGNAIYSIGNLKFTGIGEAAGRVLTTDASGNATWQSLTGTHDHFGESWIGNILSSGLFVQNNNATVTITSGIAAAGANGIFGTATSTSGGGVVGIAAGSGYAPYLGNNAGVAGTANAGNGVFGASVSGFSIYGYKGGLHTNSVAKFENANTSNTSPVVQIVNNATNPLSLELNNGFIKVSGTNKTAFTVTAVTGVSGNTSGNSTVLNYTDMLLTDIVIVTHNWQGGYIGAVGVYWTGSVWAIFREDGSLMPNNEKFNVMVIKQ